MKYDIMKNVQKYSRINLNIPFDVIVNQTDDDNELFFEYSGMDNPIFTTYNQTNDTLYIECKPIGKSKEKGILSYDEMNDTLYLDNQPISTPKEKGILYLNSKKIKSIHQDGVGNIQCNITSLKDFSFTNNGVGDIELFEDFKTDLSHLVLSNKGTGTINANIQPYQLEINSSGVGDIILSGNTTHLAIKSKGVGEIKAKKLEATYVSITSKGIGNVVVNADEKITIKSDGIGDTTVYGKPSEVDVYCSGIGKASLPDKKIHDTNAYNIKYPKKPNLLSDHMQEDIHTKKRAKEKLMDMKEKEMENEKEMNSFNSFKEFLKENNTDSKENKEKQKENQLINKIKKSL